MEMFSNLVHIACLIIVLATLWASLSEKVQDGLPVKFSLGLTSLSAYLALTQLNERTLGMLIIAIGATCLTIAFQKLVLNNHLFHHKTGEKPCLSSFRNTSPSRSSQKAPRRRGTA